MGMPGYFQFLTLLAFQVFKEEGVTAAIIETGVGGEFDSTNVVPNPIVSVITRVGKDHEITLGNTIDQIAWHKAGILKPGCHAVSTRQEQSVANVLRSRAGEKKAPLEMIDVDSRLTGVLDHKIKRVNASLAIRAAEIFLQKQCGSTVPMPLIRLLQDVRWPGRFERWKDGNINWWIDGAHNEAGLQAAAEWYADGSRFEQG